MEIAIELRTTLLESSAHSLVGCKEADIPTCFPYSSHDDTLGKMVPAIYAVRNPSAHGQKVPDSDFENATGSTEKTNAGDFSPALFF